MRRGAAVGLAAAGAAIALVAGASVVWPGLDAQETPPRAVSAWVLQADGLRYARVNTAIGELDTVRAVNNPSRIVESSAGAYMFTDSDAKVIRIDEAVPADLDAEGLRAASDAPPGTTEVDVSGDVVAYRTDAGKIYAGRLSSGVVAEIDPRSPPPTSGATGTADTDAAAAYRSDAVSVNADGDLFSYAADVGTVTRVDVMTGRVERTDRVETDVAAPVLTAAGEDWVLVDAAAGRFWTADAVGDTGTTGAVAVSNAAPGDAVYLADETGLVRVTVAEARAERIFGDSTTARGAPARPLVRGDARDDGRGEGVSAAWLPEGAGPGTLWTSTSGDVSLDYGGLALPAQRRPVLVEAGDGLILNDARSGWVWSAPDGRLLPSSQEWDIDDDAEVASTTNEREPPPVIDPRPPAAEDDAFGVRSGALVTLPVILNDHDPNEDVLAVDPASLTGLDPAFGSVTTTDDRQRLAVRVAAGASGSATFTYAVTDGTSPDGLRSEPATVTLRVVAAGENSAPQWCGVEGCQQEWPSPEVAPGGTISLPVLGDWVDPEGDPVLLLSATDDSGLGQVATTPHGDVVFQHSDASAADEQLAPLTLTVADTRGAATTKQLVVRVRAGAQPA
ncbi:Ig-like domain-containing protein, partial [Microbacterium sp.]|uniref:Ig-like domain-containing protein n=1 Tax=Microbacterium sp. TaxID=51671 RepID=UPI003C758484